MKNKIIIFISGLFVLTTNIKAQHYVLYAEKLDSVIEYDPVSKTCKEFQFSNNLGASGTLIQGSDGLLYGLLNSDSTSAGGSIYAFNPLTNQSKYVFNFNGSSTGGQPLGGLLQASNGLLYGMTSVGGNSNNGVIFCYNIKTGKDSVVYNFDNTNGSFPNGTLMQAKNGIIYGETTTGGPYNAGVLFSFDPIMGNYNVLNDSLGNDCYGDLIQASDGLLYGTSSSFYYGGGFFNYNTTANKYSKLFSFNYNSEVPYASLLEATNGLIYGATYGNTGGANGTLYYYDTINNINKTIYSFDQTHGAYPNGSLIQYPINGLIYGTAYGGGVGFGYSGGVIFSYDPILNNYKVEQYFYGLFGPSGGLLLVNLTRDSVLIDSIYGCTYQFLSPPSICYVTVDPSSMYNEIFWSKENMDTTYIDSIDIYRQELMDYVKIGRASIHSATSFIDYDSKPGTESSLYKLGMENSCSKSPMSAYHQTIMLQADLGVGNTVNLTWNSYAGQTVSYYVILRDSTGLGNWQRLDSLSSSINAYTDVHPPSFNNLRYVISTVWNLNCNPNFLIPQHKDVFHKIMSGSTFTSLSNIKSMYPIGVSIFPNPSKGIINITYNGLSGNRAEFRVRDIVSRVVQNTSLEGSIGKVSLNESDLARGVYIYQVIDEGKIIYTGKFVLIK